MYWRLIEVAQIFLGIELHDGTDRVLATKKVVPLQSTVLAAIFDQTKD
jgi:hypothetical protein